MALEVLEKLTFMSLRKKNIIFVFQLNFRTLFQQVHDEVLFKGGIPCNTIDRAVHDFHDFFNRSWRRVALPLS